MNAAKRSRQDQQRVTNGRHDEPSHKRLKSIHNHDSQGSGGLAALLSDSSTKQLTARLTNGVVDSSASRVNENHTVISTAATNGGAESVSPDISEESDAAEEAVATLTNGAAGDHNDAEMPDAEEEPSFGDILKARHPDVITVPAEAGALQTIRTNNITGHSLGTVLQQALKTNDNDLLESCFELRDIQTIKNTIQRLPSPFAAELLTRISERMYRRPGRAGALMIWVQWSLVAHGGYLAGQPEILKRLTALNQVMKQRAQGLQPLLRLKGKLDILHAQLELRRETQAARQQYNMVDDVDEEVTYKEDDIGTDWDEEEVDGTRPTHDGEDIGGPAEQEDSDAEGLVGDMLDIEAEEDDDLSEDEDDAANGSEAESSEGSFHTSEDEDDDDDDDDDDAAIPSRRPI